MVRIYNLAKGIEFADSTLVKNANPGAARFVVVQTDQVLFPKASNSLEAAVALEEALMRVQHKAVSDRTYSPLISEVAEFGIQKGAEDAVKKILESFAAVCRQKHSEGSTFSPGTQFNLHKVTEDGIEVTLGNYGLFFATTTAASLAASFKRYLIQKGIELLGRREGFFVNLPSTTLTLETSDGKALFVNRGPTAEWKNMYGMAAAGHHNPKTTLAKAQEIRYHGATTKTIPLRQLAAQQLGTELATTPEETGEITLTAVAYSTGHQIEGTEKPEIIAHVKLPFTADEVAIRIKEKAPHRWETRVLYAATQGQLGTVINGTFYKPEPPASLDEMVILGEKGLKPQTDPNSVSYWVPVHAAALLTQAKDYRESLVRRWLSAPAER